MERFLILLRGINVGGHKKILMKDLKSLLEWEGLLNVVTYIQSGNIACNFSSKEGLSKIVSKAILEKYGFEVPVLVLTKTELIQIMEKSPFSEEKKEKSYFILLDSKPDETLVGLTAEKSSQEEEFFITAKCVYIFYAKGAGKGKLGNNWFEKQLKVKATARNFRTMSRLIDLL